MAKRKLERVLPLNEQLQDILKGRIRDGTYPPGTHFPSESEIVQEFEVSRATVRSALSILSAEGYIVRRHGVGTFVSKLSQITNPINRAMGFDDLIADGGYEPGVQVRGAVAIEANAALTAKLGIETGSQLAMLEKIFTADGEPLIIVTTSIPRWVLGDSFDDVIAQPQLSEPLFDFLENRCSQRTSYMVASFWPDTAGECGVPIEGADAATPVLMMDYVAYNDNEDPIFHSLQTYIGKRMRFNLIRRRDEIGPP